MQLSPHFEREEFEKCGPMPGAAVPAYRSLCADILEPIRSRFDASIIVTLKGGYRNPEVNQAAGGVSNSQHCACADFCAADIWLNQDLQVVFDWLRLCSGLPFDQIILERESWIEKPACIHISWSKKPRREALEGLTGGRGVYKHHQVLQPPDYDSPPEIWGEV